MTTTPLHLRFWAKVKIADGCWEWTGGRNWLGYGSIWVNDFKKRITATHVMWFLRYGVWPEKHILHSCDNPPCVNPAHLSEGTRDDNQQQSVERGRHANARKTHCKHGHLFDEENTTTCGNKRYCKACQRVAWAMRYPNSVPRRTA